MVPVRKLGKRALPDRSQALRRGMQLGFLALNGWLGVQFYFFVRYYETGGRWPRASRPAGVEGWLPIAALMNLKAWILTGTLSRIHPAGTLLLITFLAASLIFRKSFCGWLCPVGTVSGFWLAPDARRSGETSTFRDFWTSRCAASSTFYWRFSSTRSRPCPWRRFVNFWIVPTASSTT